MNNNKNMPVKREVVEGLPSYLQAGSAKKYASTIDSSDITIPRIKLCQPMSTAGKDQNPDLRDGQFYSSLTAESFGSEMKVIFIDSYKSRVWFSAENKMLAQQSYLRTGVTDIVGPEAEAIKNNPALLADGDEQFNYWTVRVEDLVKAVATKTIPSFYLWSIGGIAMKNARKMNSTIKINEGKDIPIFVNIFDIGVSKEQTKKGVAYIPTFSLSTGENPTADEYALLTELWEQINRLGNRMAPTAHAEASGPFTSSPDEVI